MKIKLVLKLVLTTAILNACSAKKDESSSGGVAFNAPSAAEIVEQATPSALKSGARSLNLFCADACDTASEVITELTTNVFTQSNDSMVEAPAYYLYWIEKGEERLAEIKTRLASADPSNTEACYNKESTAVTISFPVSTDDVSTTVKLSCVSDISTPDGGAAKFGFGFDDEYYYVMDLYHKENNSTRYVITKVSVDGNTADVWFIGSRYETINSTSTEIYNAIRATANKATGEFSFNKVEDPRTTSKRHSIFANSDGTSVYVEFKHGAGAPQTTPHSFSLVDFSSAHGDTSGTCRSATDIDAAGASCTQLLGTNSGTLPANFGVSSKMHTDTFLVDGTFNAGKTAFGTALSDIRSIDFAALGIGEL